MASAATSSQRLPSRSLWLPLAAFVGASWIVDRLFTEVISRLALDNSTRPLFRHVEAGSWRPFLLNLALHWIPKAVLITILGVLTLRAASVPVRETLFRPVQRRHLWIVAAAAMGLVLYQLIRSWADGARGLSPLVGMGPAFVYSVRFIPSAWVEEVTFRAVLFGAVRARTSAAAGWLASLLLFVVAHLYGGASMAIHAALIGIILTGVYQVTGALWACVALHAATNVVYALLNYGG